ncbi:hypothetical protein SKAU_G00077930 [Synaphobranchus kaupii]|uniref:Receptor ligand binding region domain-containing protein n=1 Tax=Synaphobranchus kaupii TaxID=118154 RepID=A0A9Q1FV38_SYNKA|nr:hypothetical protein SKAU_G00077930 [Synaphobranchus kaupii]
MRTCVDGNGPFANGACADPKHFLPWQLFHYMKQTSFTIMGEEVSFNENGDPIASYDLVNWHQGRDGSLQLVKVGFYDASLGGEKDLFINESAIRFQGGQQVCPFPLLMRCSAFYMFLIWSLIPWTTIYGNFNLVNVGIHQAMHLADIRMAI